MKIRSELSADKLRGGFYSPVPLVDECLARVEALVGDRRNLRVLEPSAGDGAFLRGLQSRAFADRVDWVTAIEPQVEEAAKCSAVIDGSPFGGDVHLGSAVRWALGVLPAYDVAVGNPPFVRFQFVGEDDKQDTATLAANLDLPLKSVGNLWIPVLLGALSKLKEGGVFAFIIPAECLTGSSAGLVRLWLAENVADLRFDLFPPMSFPEVLQEVVVLSGRRSSHAPRPCPVEFTEIGENGGRRVWSHTVEPATGSWTRLLLTPQQLDAVTEAEQLSVVRQLVTVTKFEVAAVTGANDYFCVDAVTLDDYALHPWALPLVARLRHAPGLRFNSTDHEKVVVDGSIAYLLDFSAERPDPELAARSALYLRQGEARDLHRRYKTGIREPWYRVPFIRPGVLMLSKRSHRYPRVVVNEAGAVTTDTIYRGTMQIGYEGRQRDLVAGFHGSLTLLSAELEGRSFGGGVLELVPSEVGRLRVPLMEGFGRHLDHLDEVARTASEDAVIEETDRLVAASEVGLQGDLAGTIAEAYQAIRARRIERNASRK